MERYGAAQNRVLQEGLKSARASGFFQGLNGLVGTGSIVMVLWYGARQVRLQSSPPTSVLHTAALLPGDGSRLSSGLRGLKMSLRVPWKATH